MLLCSLTLQLEEFVLYRNLSHSDIETVNILQFAKISTICVHYSRWRWKRTRLYQYKMIGFSDKRCLLTRVFKVLINVICSESLNAVEKTAWFNVYSSSLGVFLPLTNRFSPTCQNSILLNWTNWTVWTNWTKVKLTQALTLKGNLDSQLDCDVQYRRLSVYGCVLILQTENGVKSTFGELSFRRIRSLLSPSDSFNRSTGLKWIQQTTDCPLELITVCFAEPQLLTNVGVRSSSIPFLSANVTTCQTEVPVGAPVKATPRTEQSLN